MDYEKKYKEALSIARSIIEDYKNRGLNDILSYAQEDLSAIFPELEMSDDESVIRDIRVVLESSATRIFKENGQMPVWYDRAVAWLEKQGEQKPIIEMKSAEESLGIDSETYSKIVDECIYGEQKPADNVEPKFRVGNWFVNNINKDIFLIKSINNGYCTLEDIKGNIISPCLPPCESESHLWTIADAKDGDILCTYECWGPKIVFILKEAPKKHYALSYHCYYNIMYPHFASDSEKGCLAPNDEDVKPATKEQRDLLFQKMKEAGYEWDDKKKELKKIEQKPAEWSEIDKANLEDSIYFIKEFRRSNLCDNESRLQNSSTCIEWLASLKDRVQPKQEWSNWDKTMIESIEALCDEKLKSVVFQDIEEHVNDIKDWLKSLKDRVQPQPKQRWSEEDERNLQGIIDEIEANRNHAPGYDIATYDRFLSWLKSLKDRALPQSKQEWSEDDETTKNNISHIIRQYDKISKRENQPCYYVGDCLLWMQNIKDRVQPQPKSCRTRRGC